MTIHRTTRVADAVLSVFIALYDDEEKSFYLEPYCNGRERGWALSNFGADKRTAVFSEFRNSDDIVVYLGEGYTGFSMQGNVPSEEIYNNKKFFGSTNYVGAVEYIAKHLGAY